METSSDISNIRLLSSDTNNSQARGAYANDICLEHTKLYQFTQVCNVGLKNLIEIASNDEYSWLRVSNKLYIFVDFNCVYLKSNHSKSYILTYSCYYLL